MQHPASRLGCRQSRDDAAEYFPNGMANAFMNDQVVFFVVLALTLGLFIHGRIHYDIVALLALLTLTVVGIIPGTEAFSGLGHPAVVTVGAVLVVGRAVQRSGALSVLVRLLARSGKNAVAQVGSLTALSAMLSMVINNVAALSLMMPVSIQLARWARRSPSTVLMPLAFASLLGGMVTLIGTPTNIIVATFRTEAGGAPFEMFDFTPVGLGVVVTGVVFLALIGWRLVPQRQGARIGVGGFEVEQHTYELEVPQALAGLRIEDVLGDMDEDIHVIGLVRNEKRYSAPSHTEILDPGDILIVEAEPVDLDELMGSTGLGARGGTGRSRRHGKSSPRSRRQGRGGRGDVRFPGGASNGPDIGTAHEVRCQLAGREPAGGACAGFVREYTSARRGHPATSREPVLSRRGPGGPWLHRDFRKGGGLSSVVAGACPRLGFLPWRLRLPRPVW